ncbi:MAG: hypothetical protein V3U58_03875 [Thermodesulfobacteriota bacterium]
MAKIETEITLKLEEEELTALKGLLEAQHAIPSAFDLSNSERDLLNGIYFEITDND